MIRLGVLALLLVACARAPEHVPSEVEPYVQSFLETQGGERSLVSIHFVDDMQAVGWCDAWTGTISIKRQAWDTAGDLWRQYIVWHEMGHCVLGQMNHSTELQPDGCPTSFMFDGMPSYQCLKELFNK